MILRGGENVYYVRDYVAMRLAKFKVPARAWFSSDPLPRMASEKIFKRKIREEIKKHILKIPRFEKTKR